MFIPHKVWVLQGATVAGGTRLAASQGCRAALPNSRSRALTLKTVLIAITAAVALIGAAVIAVPSTEYGSWVCTGLGLCPSF